ncbi:MAG: N-acetylmuramoyl-L-alanine amidase family protein [Prevotella sp.]
MLKKRLFFFITISLFAVSMIAANKAFTLVIDPGHGGKDTGASGAFSREKDINLTVALAFGQYVERNCPDVKVIYTRKTDVFIPLIERANIANKNKADLFISVHTNALPPGRIARGFETYTLGMHRASDNLDVAKRENSVILVEKDYKHTYQGFDPRSAESYIMFELIQGQNMSKSVELAKLIQQNVCTIANRIDKGVHQAGFLVLRETSMPSCLVELGFITTPDEEQSLNSSNTINNIANGLYKAFLAYKNKYSKQIVVPYKKDKAEEIPLPNAFPQEYTPIKNNESDMATVNITANTPKPERVLSDSSKVKIDNFSDARPVFKVQLIASSKPLDIQDKHFKDLSGYEYYKENNLYKYTYGASNNYNEILELRRSLSSKFPQAFIIAFKNNKRININEAITEFNNNNK